MKKIIGRTLFFFKNGDEDLSALDRRFFPLGVLLNRLLNEKYNGKKIKFMNIHFLTEKTYQLHPLSPKHYTHSYGDVLWYNDVFDVQNFERMPGDQQKIFIWRRAYEILVNASKSSKNDKLLEASGHAYNSGIEIKLNPDYKMIEAEVVLHGNLMSAAVWVNFCDDGMYSKLTLEKDGITFFEKSIDKATNSVEFFLEMYKKIEVKGNDIIVKGHRDVDYLPLKINIAPDGLWKLSSK